MKLALEVLHKRFSSTRQALINLVHVYMHLRCGGIFSDSVTTNFLLI